MESTQLIIVGGGCAGYSAAIYASRAGLAPLLFEGLLRGGQLATTTDVENYPGFVDAVQGPWLMDQMRGQAAKHGAKIVGDTVVKIDRESRDFIVSTDSSGVWRAKAVIMATGASAKWLGIESESRYRNKGVSACATCDGFFYRGKDVAVIGGGNVAVSECLFLANMANSVKLVHRRSTLRAEKGLQDLLFKNSKIEPIWNHAVAEVLGADKVTGLRLCSVESGAQMDIKVDGVFVAIGHTPSTSLVQEILELDSHGYIKVIPGSSRTKVDGLFAAGDVQDSVYRQAVTSAGSGCMAALDAERYLSELA